MVGLIFFILAVFLLIAALFGPTYWRYRKNKKYPLSEEELKQYLNESDLRHEEKVRKRWLLSLFFIQISSFFSLLLPWLAASEELRPYVLSETGNTEVGILLPIIFSFLSFLISYHCAYRKRGTILLMLSIVLLPLQVLGTVLLPLKVEAGSSIKNFDSLSFSFIDCGVLLFLVGILFWFWVNCIRLRSVNAFRKSQINLARKNKYFQEVIIAGA